MGGKPNKVGRPVRVDLEEWPGYLLSAAAPGVGWKYFRQGA